MQPADVPKKLVFNTGDEEVVSHKVGRVVRDVECFGTFGVSGVAADFSIECLLSADSIGEVFAAWASIRIPPGEKASLPRIADLLTSDIALIDEIISRQVDAILHHSTFQKLEAGWRSLDWLINQVDRSTQSLAGERWGGCEVRIFNVSKRELTRDFDSSLEFDRSVVWKVVYENEFGTAGGTPYGLILADFSFGNSVRDIDLLGGLAEVAAASFCPLIASPKPELFGVDSFHDLDLSGELETLHSGDEYIKWRALRDREESRFIGLILPRVLARLPFDGVYGLPDASCAPEQTWSNRGFRYREKVDGPRGGSRLWASAAWAFAGITVAEFCRSGWFSDIRGGSRGKSGGGVVSGLNIDSFGGSEPYAWHRGPTEMVVTDASERRLMEAGFVPLTAAGSDGRAVFHSNQSVHLPRQFDRAAASVNSRISSMLQYTLCVSRFAHYLKVIARDKVGAIQSASDLEYVLNEWIKDYVTPDDRASADTRAQLPLRAAEVQVLEEAGSIGGYRVVMRLQPHFQVDALATSVRLTTTVRRR